MTRRIALLIGIAASLAGCSSSGGSPSAPVVGAARVYHLTGFQPAGPVQAGRPVTLSFTVTQPSGAAVTGVLVQLDDFNVSLRDSAGVYKTWKRVRGLKVEKHDPYQAHIDLLDQYIDKNIHDVVAYLETLK